MHDTITLLQTNDAQIGAAVWEHVKALVCLDVYEEAEMNGEVVYSPCHPSELEDILPLVKVS